MLKYQIIESDDPEWDKILYSLPAEFHDINFTARYHKLMETVYSAKAELFVATEDEKIFFHPYLIRQIANVGSVQIDDELFDIQSAFGYTGPVTNTDNTEFIQASNCLFEQVCSSKNIVAEFIRFNPLLQNHNLSVNTHNIELSNLKEYIVMDLTQSLETINQNYKHSLRTNIRVAKEYPNWDWTVSNQKDISLKAGGLIQKRLDEKRVEQLYNLHTNYYEKLSDFIISDGYTFIAYDKLTDKPIAAEVFIFDKNHVYFLHSARDIEDPRSSNINTCLIHEAILFFKNEGFKWFFMGGGVTNSSDDSLLKFKKKFSQNVRNFFIGKRIFNNETYSKLCDIWEKEFPQLIEKRKGIVLKYQSVINILFRIGMVKLSIHFIFKQIM